jgi:ribose transport system ATP-binding protein
MNAPLRLVAREISQRFGNTLALDNVSFQAHTGEILTVLGENGAGKSTLMSILAGLFRPDSGTISLDGQPYNPRSPADARQAGVAIVHQELCLCPHLSVADNILLGMEPTDRGLLSHRRIQQRAQEVLAQLHSPIDPRLMVAELPIASQQIVEIARALVQPDCRVLILDEPTSSLSARDSRQLFTVLKRLAEQGLTLIYISHFLEEVFEIGHRYLVLRDGRYVAEGRLVDTNQEQILEQMTGTLGPKRFQRTERSVGEKLLQMEQLSGHPRPTNATLTLHRGEVLGIAGLVGAGRTELFRCLYGLDSITSGTIQIATFKGPATADERLLQGVGFLSENRKTEGLALDWSIQDNLTLSNLRSLGSWLWVSPRKRQQAAEQWVQKLGIKCDNVSQSVRHLSGGNQQKVALARLLHADVDLFLLDEPTRGVDIPSKHEIYQWIDQLACSGKAVLMISSDFTELLGVCDTIAVMNRGELGPPRSSKSCTHAQLMHEASTGEEEQA